MNHLPEPDRTRLTLGRDLIRRDPTTADMLAELVTDAIPDAELVVGRDGKVRIPDSCDHRERGWAKLRRQTILDMVERGASGDELRAYMQEQIILAERVRDTRPSTVKALILQADGTTEVRQIGGSCVELKAVLGGGTLGAAPLSGRSGAHMYVDDDEVPGASPVNYLATALIGHFNRDFLGSGVVVGMAVVVGDDREGGEADVPDNVLAVVDSLNAARS